MFSDFIKSRYKDIFGSKAKLILKEFSKEPKKCIRINTLKINPKECLRRLKLKGFFFSRVPWSRYSYFIEKEPKAVSATVEHLMGYFFIQDASSLLPVIELAPKRTDVVLDMTAAPGGKTTHIAQIMKNEGTIVALEINKNRMDSLLSNLERMGVENTIVLRASALKVKQLGLKFDKILLDAPCTADGTMGKNPRLRISLTNEDYLKYSRKQKELITAANAVLKDKGVLVYSTCSLAPEENEEVVEYAVNTLGMKIKELKTKRYLSPGMTRFFNEKHSSFLKKCGRVLPYQYHTQGFFLAKLIK